MTEILTAEEIQATLNQIKETEEQFGHLADEYDIDCKISHESLKKTFSTIESLQSETQTLQSQNKALVEALERMTKSELPAAKVADYEGNDDSDPIAQYEMGEALGYHYQAVEARKTLSLLPSEALERWKADNKIIETAAKCCVQWQTRLACLPTVSLNDESVKLVKAVDARLKLGSIGTIQLSEETLERERKREAVVRAAIDLINGMPWRDGINSLEASLYDAVEALEALESDK